MVKVILEISELNKNEKINYDERWITQYIYYRRKQNEELLKKREFIIKIINYTNFCFLIN